MKLQPKKGKAQVASTTEALSENASATKQMELSMSDCTETTADSATAVITPETMPAITWQQARVVTTELLARLYGTDPVRIQQNYLRNTGRFEAGKHFHKLEGEQLGEFKKCSRELTSFQIVGGRARSLVVWTERGAARHAKMLETDAAWDVFEQLEDCYFAVQAERQPTTATPYTVQPSDTLNEAQQIALRAMLESNVKRLPHAKQAGAMIKGWSKLKAHFGVSYRQIPAGEFEEALSIVARHVSEWELVDEAPKPSIATALAPEESNTKAAFDAATQAAASVQTAVFNAVLSGNDEWKYSRWLLAFVTDSKIAAPAIVRKLPHDAFATSWATLARDIADGECLRSTPELLDMASACMHRLQQRSSSARLAA